MEDYERMKGENLQGLVVFVEGVSDLLVDRLRTVNESFAHCPAAMDWAQGTDRRIVWTTDWWSTAIVY